jgi:hypothetical protein
MKSVKEAVEASSDVEIGFDSGSMTSACSAKILRTAWTPGPAAKLPAAA